MKKSIVAIAFALIIPVLSQANTQSQASEAEKVKSYEMGIRTAREGERNIRLWKQGKGDPEMAKAYQEGLRFAHKAKAEHEKLYQQAKENIDNEF